MPETCNRANVACFRHKYFYLSDGSIVIRFDAVKEGGILDCGVIFNYSLHI